MNRVIDHIQISDSLKIENSPKSDYVISSNSKDLLVSIDEYRKILNDRHSSDEIIKRRLHYLEAFTRNIVKEEIRKYIQESKNEHGKKNFKQKKLNSQFI